MSRIMPQIEHVIVLMLENRSLDNLLGWIYEGEAPKHSVPPPPPGSQPSYDGLVEKKFWNRFSSNEEQVSDFNKLKASQCQDDTPRGDPQYVHKGTDGCNTPWVDPFEPYLAVNQQLYWPDPRAKCPTYEPVPGQEPEMLGFLANYRRHEHVTSDDQALEILQTYTPEQLPVLSTLARQYAVCDRWFASVPSQTYCNRGFVGAGTSCGQTDNSLTHPFDATTVWNSFERAGVSWRIYFQDGLLGSYCFTRHLFTALHHHLPDERFCDIRRFYDDVASGDLPAYSFLEPAWNFTFFNKDLVNGNSYHPPAHLAPGEAFVRELFAAVSTGPAWDKTLLVITFDEHGGTWDHVPPVQPAKAPWDAPGYEPPPVLEHGFDFRRYGVRVPTLLISPWVEEGTVFRSDKRSPAGDEIPFDHTSIPATLLEWQGIEKFDRAGAPTWGLGARTDVAPNFGKVLTRSSPRTSLPVIPVEGCDAVKETFAAAAAQPLTDFQSSLFGLVVHEASAGARPWHDPRNHALVARMHETLETQGDLERHARKLRWRFWLRRLRRRVFG